jgi:hypothetical protein
MTHSTINQSKILSLFRNHDELNSFRPLFSGLNNVALITSGSSEFLEVLSITHAEPALITLTASLYPDAEPQLVSGLNRLYPNTEILLLTLDADPLPPLHPLARDKVRHLLVTPDDDGGDMDSLQGAIARLVAKNPWSLDNCVESGTTVHEFSLQTAGDKEILIAVLEQCIAGEQPELELLRQRAALLADEMIENALYGAPQDEAGKKLYAKGDERVVLDKENILFRFAFDGETLAMEITDDWGTLHPDLIVDFLARNQEADSMEELEAGGRGLFIIWRFMDHLHVNIRPGERTVLGGHLKAVPDFDPETPRSFFISTAF